MKVVTLQVDAEGRPVVPGAALVLRGAGGWWFAEFSPVGEGGHVSLWEIEAGLYAWKGVRGAPDLGGTDFGTWAASADGRSKLRYRRVTGTLRRLDENGDPVDVQVTNRVIRFVDPVPAGAPSDAAPWTIGDSTITKAVPALPSVAGAVTDEDTGGVSPPRRALAGLRPGGGSP
ncbi:MAG: hypothetical protein GWN84_20600 [Gammaproteobacteria bacterium]|nr:hypothetical protein [Gammaproteobacteria bacterium]NIR85162.1 hypothetical protein [Gammaproteobacteria bacterium]NIU06211.1 hypothetical protein [Gammaproteobacteria bacterium]NIX87484.1 hypothetical protein [Gammaproteobacteria bacterium]